MNYIHYNIEDTIFRGYQRTQGKQPKEKRIGVDLPPFEKIAMCNSFCGVFAPNYGMIDIDNKKDSDIVKQLIIDLKLKLLVRETTKGIHVYGKFPSMMFGRKTQEVTHHYTPIGVEVDVKSGYSNSISVLQVHNVPRQIIYGGEFEELDEIPTYLIPPVDDKYAFKLQDLGEDGSGRNNVLYEHMKKLCEYKFNKDECISILNLINKYHFNSPLDNSEIEHICSDRKIEHFSKSSMYFDKKGKFTGHQQFARDIYNEYHCCKFEGRLYFYYNGVYTDDTDILYDEIRDKDSRLLPNQVKIILDHLNGMISKNIKSENDFGYARFKNGIVNLRTGELLPHSPDIFVTVTIPHNYKNTDSKFGNYFINYVEPSCDKELLFEIGGRILWNRPIDSECFMFTGSGGNGKSKFGKMIQYAVGTDNMTPTAWGDLGSGFSSDDGRKALVVIAEELDEDTFKKTGFFFKGASGLPVMGNPKYGKRCKYQFNALLISTCNEIPKLLNMTLEKPFRRRVNFIEFKCDLEHNRIENLDEQLFTEEVYEWFLYNSVKHFIKVINTKSYTINQATIDLMDDYITSLDVLKTWVKNLPCDMIENHSYGDLKSRFEEYLDDNCIPCKFDRFKMLRYIKELKGYALKHTNAGNQFKQ